MHKRSMLLAIVTLPFVPVYYLFVFLTWISDEQAAKLTYTYAPKMYRRACQICNIHPTTYELNIQDISPYSGHAGDGKYKLGDFGVRPSANNIFTLFRPNNPRLFVTVYYKAILKYTHHSKVLFMYKLASTILHEVKHGVQYRERRLDLSKYNSMEYSDYVLDDCEVEARQFGDDKSLRHDLVSYALSKNTY